MKRMIKRGLCILNVVLLLGMGNINCLTDEIDGQTVTTENTETAVVPTTEASATTATATDASATTGAASATTDAAVSTDLPNAATTATDATLNQGTAIAADGTVTNDNASLDGTALTAQTEGVATDTNAGNENATQGAKTSDTAQVQPGQGDITQEINDLIDNYKNMDVPFEQMVCIYSAEDLYKISEDTSAYYILMNDIDMSGKEWTPVDFHGVFDGNGFGIMNLTITETNSDTRITYDGNRKPYDTVFAGLFGVLENAIVKDLSLVGVNVELNENRHCFAGTIAGYLDRSIVDNCVIDGTVSLTVSTKMFGVSGIVGYGGAGLISNCNADVTLICIDEDKEDKDEQFLGGVIATGFTSIDGCKIYIKGYDSDHGYVHDGGLNGMYMISPNGTFISGYVTNNYVEGYITFFEDNSDRRAYCSEFIGENLSRRWTNSGNTSNFKRDERYEYDKNLLPHNCENPVFEDEIIEGDCENFGYTLKKCSVCGEYSYKSLFTKRVHNIDEWDVVLEPTYEAEGMEKGTCSLCNRYEFRFIPQLELPVVEEEEEIEEISAISSDLTDAEANDNKGAFPLVPVLVVGIVVLALGTGAIVFVNVSGSRKRNNRRSKRRRR